MIWSHSYKSSIQWKYTNLVGKIKYLMFGLINYILNNWLNGWVYHCWLHNLMIKYLKWCGKVFHHWFGNSKSGNGRCIFFSPLNKLIVWTTHFYAVVSVKCVFQEKNKNNIHAIPFTFVFTNFVFCGFFYMYLISC